MTQKLENEKLDLCALGLLLFIIAQLEFVLTQVLPYMPYIMTFTAFGIIVFKYRRFPKRAYVFSALIAATLFIGLAHSWVVGINNNNFFLVGGITLISFMSLTLAYGEVVPGFGARGVVVMW